MNLINETKSPFWLFAGTFLIGLIVSVILMTFILNANGGLTVNILSLPREAFISIQAIQMIGFFILPPVLFALLSKHDLVPLFNLDKPIKTNKYFICILIAISLFPIVLNLEYYIMQMPMPESWKTMAETQKSLNEQVISMLIDSPDFSNFLLMLLIIGLGAGLTEELFFRGALMPIISNTMKSQWAGIFISSILFSLMHLNAYDFIPILIIGMLLGWIYTQTQDLKLNIFLHATFNSLQVILNYLHQINVLPGDIDKLESFHWYLPLICIPIVYFLIKKLIQTNEPISH